MERTRLTLLLLLSSLYAKAETREQAVIRHLIDEAAPQSFVRVRGKPYRQVANMWEAVTMPVGARVCLVDWTDSAKHPELNCLMLSTPNRAEADREFLRLRDVVASVVPGWKDIRNAPPAEDDFRMFFEPHPEGEGVRRTIAIQYSKTSSGNFQVDLEFSAAGSPATARQTAEQNRRKMAQWVAEDVTEYLAAAAEGFASYKGQEKRNDLLGAYGVRLWDCARRPFLAEQCQISQHAEKSDYSCVLFTSPWGKELEMQYEELVADVKDALPKSWSVSNSTPEDHAVSTEFLGSNGLSGKIWIESAAERHLLKFEIHGKLSRRR